MNRVIKILMERDNLSLEDAKHEVMSFVSDAQQALEEGEDGDYIEEMLMDYLGLEPDYIPDLLF